MVDEERPGLTIAQAAHLLNLSAIRVKQLIREGWIKRDDKKRLTVEAVVRGYLDFKEAQIDRLKKNAADNELRRAKAREIEIKIAKMESELVPREVVEEIIQLIVEELRKRLPSLPAKFTRDAHERRRLGELIKTVLGEITELGAKGVQSLRVGLDAAEGAREIGA